MTFFETFLLIACIMLGIATVSLCLFLWQAIWQPLSMVSAQLDVITQRLERMADMARPAPRTVIKHPKYVDPANPPPVALGSILPKGPQ